MKRVTSCDTKEGLIVGVVRQNFVSLYTFANGKCSLITSCKRPHNLCGICLITVTPSCLLICLEANNGIEYCWYKFVEGRQLPAALLFQQLYFGEIVDLHYDTVLRRLCLITPKQVLLTTIIEVEASSIIAVEKEKVSITAEIGPKKNYFNPLDEYVYKATRNLNKPASSSIILEQRTVQTGLPLVEWLSWDYSATKLELLWRAPLFGISTALMLFTDSSDEEHLLIYNLHAVMLVDILGNIETIDMSGYDDISSFTLLSCKGAKADILCSMGGGKYSSLLIDTARKELDSESERQLKPFSTPSKLFSYADHMIVLTTLQQIESGALMICCLHSTIGCQLLISDLVTSNIEITLSMLSTISEALTFSFEMIDTIQTFPGSAVNSDRITVHEDSIYNQCSFHREAQARHIVSQHLYELDLNKILDVKFVAASYGVDGDGPNAPRTSDNLMLTSPSTRQSSLLIVDANSKVHCINSGFDTGAETIEFLQVSGASNCFIQVTPSALVAFSITSTARNKSEDIFEAKLIWTKTLKEAINSPQVHPEEKIMHATSCHNRVMIFTRHTRIECDIAVDKKKGIGLTCNVHQEVVNEVSSVSSCVVRSKKSIHDEEIMYLTAVSYWETNQIKLINSSREASKDESVISITKDTKGVKLVKLLPRHRESGFHDLPIAFVISISFEGQIFVHSISLLSQSMSIKARLIHSYPPLGFDHFVDVVEIGVKDPLRTDALLTSADMQTTFGVSIITAALDHQKHQIQWHKVTRDYRTVYPSLRSLIVSSCTKSSNVPLYLLVSHTAESCALLMGQIDNAASPSSVILAAQTVKHVCCYCCDLQNQILYVVHWTLSPDANNQVLSVYDAHTLQCLVSVPVDSDHCDFITEALKEAVVQNISIYPLSPWIKRLCCDRTPVRHNERSGVVTLIMYDSAQTDRTRTDETIEQTLIYAAANEQTFINAAESTVCVFIVKWTSGGTITSSPSSSLEFLDCFSFILPHIDLYFYPLVVDHIGDHHLLIMSSEGTVQVLGWQLEVVVPYADSAGTPQSSDTFPHSAIVLKNLATISVDKVSALFVKGDTNMRELIACKGDFLAICIPQHGVQVYFLHRSNGGAETAEYTLKVCRLIV